MVLHLLVKTLNLKQPRRWVAFLAILGTLLSCRIASAQFFSSEASYDSSALLYDQIYFQVPPPANPVTGFVNEGTSYTIGGVTFDGPDSSLFVIGPQAVGGLYVPYDVPGEYDFPHDGTATFDTFGAQGDATPMTVTATLPGYVTAVGTEIGGFEAPADVNVDVTLAGEAPQTDTFTVHDSETSGLDFVGFIAPVDDYISSIAFTDSTENAGGFVGLDFDNFTYGITDAVPEPGSLALIGLGALALVIFRRRLVAL